jgi:hypothetical protein
MVILVVQVVIPQSRRHTRHGSDGQRTFLVPEDLDRTIWKGQKAYRKRMIEVVRDSIRLGYCIVLYFIDQRKNFQLILGFLKLVYKMYVLRKKADDKEILFFKKFMLCYISLQNFLKALP